MQALLLTNHQTSFVAGLDVRAKLLLCFAGSVASIVFSSPLSLGLLMLASTVAALGAARAATIGKAYLISALMMLMALGCSALVGLAVPDLMRWSLVSLASPFLRMLISVNLLLMLSLSTPVREMFNRLRAAGLPGWLHIPLSVAIRFIPAFLGDCGQIRDAARLRPGKGIRGLWRCLAVPLVFRVLYSADDLAMAAEIKGINAATKARAEAMPGMGLHDYLALALALVCLGAAAMLQYAGPRFTPLPM